MKAQYYLCIAISEMICFLLTLLLPFISALNAQADLLNVMPNGNVGIGISTPLFPLDISATQGVMRLVTTAHTNGSVIDLRSNAGSPTFLGAINFNNTAGTTPGQIAYTGANTMTFKINGSERFRINASGNVGIGTISPEEKLEVVGAIQISNSQDPTPDPGTIRWSGFDFEGWNGEAWVTLTGGKTAPVKDIDGNSYSTMKFGDRTWMTQNLRTTQYRDGTIIPNVFSGSTWASLTSGAYCWYDNDDALYEVPYGKLYNWYAMTDTRGLCPVGWHVPTEGDWTNLIDFLGGAALAGGKMKEKGTVHWLSPNTDATNESGFTGLPGGARSYDGSFLNINDSGYWWWPSAAIPGWNSLKYNSGYSEIFSMVQANYGLSLRCIRD